MCSYSCTLNKISRGLLHPTVRVQTVMPRRATRPVALAVKKEVVDQEEIDSRDTPPTPTPPVAVLVSSKDKPKSSIKRVPTKALRGDSVAGGGGGGGSSCSRPALSSRFFPSPSYSAARGRKRKAASSGSGSNSDGDAASPPSKSGLCQAVAVDKPPKRGGGGRRFTGDNSLPDTESSAAPLSTTTPAAGSTTTTTAAAAAPAASSQRRSSRFNVVKKEELEEGLDFPECYPLAAGATACRGRGSGQRSPPTSIDWKSPTRSAVGAAIDDVDLRQTEKKLKGRGKKSPRKVKVKTQEGKEKLEEKPILPRLAEKAALIIQVMDKLYPDPPIPINHLVRTHPIVLPFPSSLCH